MLAHSPLFMDSTPRAPAKIEQDAARDDRVEFLHSKVLQAGAGRELPFHEAVVEAHLVAFAIGTELHADVAEAVELCADLADFGSDELVMIDQLLGPERVLRSASQGCA
jgi:hypothetical protein